MYVFKYLKNIFGIRILNIQYFVVSLIFVSFGIDEI